MRGELSWLVLGAVALGAFLGIGSLPAKAQTIAEKAEVCAGCHGQDGKPIDKTTPVIWGQQQGYLYIQLRAFKRGDRQNDIMQPFASMLQPPDLVHILHSFLKN